MSMPEVRSMIVAHDVRKDYEGGLIQALRGISLEIAAGEVLAVVGPSGGGKSTLLHVLSSLDTPSGGRIIFDGRDLEEYTPHHRFRAEQIGFVFQFHYLLNHLTLLENVILPMKPLGLTAHERKNRALELLERMGLAAKAGSFPNRISGGERQRGAIARALANDPRVIFADEPTGSVDTVTGDRIMDFIMGHCRETGRTLVMATHNEELARRADRILRIENGVVVES